MSRDELSAKTDDDPLNDSGLRDGCEETYIALYREFWVPLHTYASQLVASSDDAADLIQDGFSPRELNRVREIILEYLDQMTEAWYGHCGKLSDDSDR